MKKRALCKTIAMIISVIMVLLLSVACGNKPSDKTEPDNNDNVIENTVIFD